MPAVAEYLPWDSQFFGVRIARLAGHRLTTEVAAEAESWCHANRIDCLYFLADADDAVTVTIAEARAFHFADLRVTLERPLDNNPAPPTPAIRMLSPEDLPRLRGIARASHRDSRFYYDPRFPRSRCDALYDAWIERSAGGWADAVLVAECDSVAAGYLSCHLSQSGAGSIGLIAVAPEYQGKGLGRQLIVASLAYFREHGMACATVVTQGRNIPSQRLYQRSGFVTRSVQLWYHRWFTTEAG